MKILSSHNVGIAQGETIIFSEFENGGDMWLGSGPRERLKSIVFATPFRTPPVVHLSLSMWDIKATTAVRADIRAENISVTGFDIVFSTWSDTRIARVRANWLAIGEMVYHDNWELG